MKRNAPKTSAPTKYKLAFDKWWRESGEMSSNSRTLGDSPDYYLSNRLKNAFRAGYNAAEAKGGGE